MIVSRGFVQLSSRHQDIWLCPHVACVSCQDPPKKPATDGATLIEEGEAGWDADDEELLLVLHSLISLPILQACKGPERAPLAFRGPWALKGALYVPFMDP